MTGMSRALWEFSGGSGDILGHVLDGFTKTEVLITRA